MSRNRRKKRDTVDISNSKRMFFRRRRRQFIKSVSRSDKLDPIKDRRFFRPLLDSDPVDIDGRRSSYVESYENKNLSSSFNKTPKYQVFLSPARAVECIRRSRRRRALFSSGRAGKGRRIYSKRRRTEFSKISCKG